MNYFILTQDERITNAAVPDGISQAIPKEMTSPERIHELDRWYLHFSIKPQPSESVFVDFIERPYPLWSEPLKQHLMKCFPALEGQPVLLFDLPRAKQQPYFLPALPVIDCLSGLAEFHPTGTIKHLVIDKGKIPHVPIFRLGGVIENLTIVNLAVAESLLRRDYVGLMLTKVDAEPAGLSVDEHHAEV